MRLKRKGSARKTARRKNAVCRLHQEVQPVQEQPVEKKKLQPRIH